MQEKVPERRVGCPDMKPTIEQQNIVIQQAVQNSARIERKVATRDMKNPSACALQEEI